jgi:hypothetical protein
MKKACGAACFATMVIAACFGPLLPVSQAGELEATTLKPTDIARRLEELEKEIAKLRSQLAALQGQQADEAAAVAASATGASPSIKAAVATTTTAPSEPRNLLTKILGPTKLSGFIDVYYALDFNHPASRTSGLRSFEGSSGQFAFNLAELIIDKPPDAANSRLGYRFSLGFGQAINAVNASDPAGLGFAQYLKEAYFSYLVPVGKGLQVDVGKFVTPHGAEVIESSDNWNYTRGLLFSYAIPYYHFGARLKYTFADKYAISGFIVNGWNNISDNNTGKTVGASFTWSPTPKFSIIENYMVGPEAAGSGSPRRHLSDTVVAYSPISKLSLMANFDYARGDRIPGLNRPVFWSGVAAYARYQFDAQHALAGRYEFFKDGYGFTTGTPQRVQEFTATFQRIIGHDLVTRFEFRRDFSNAPVFFKGAIPVTAQNTFTIGLVYLFHTPTAE